MTHLSMHYPCVLIIASLHVAEVTASLTCNEELRTNTGGIISTPNYNNLQEENGSCVYSITSTTRYVEIEMMNVVQQNVSCIGEQCCSLLYLSISTNKHAGYQYCSHNISFTTLGLESHIVHIRFVVPFLSKNAVKLMYTVSRQCRGYEYECNLAVGCYEKSEICDDIPHCADGSDEKVCSRKYCRNDFHALDYFQCKSGHCVARDLVNNGLKDCDDGSDEDPYVAYLLLILAILLSLFVMLLCRWFLYRRDIRTFMEHMPEFPLPPFVGPGDHAEYEVEITDADLQSGGEIFEAYAESRRQQQQQSDSSRHRHRIRHVKPKESNKPSISAVDGDDSLLALASLSVDINDCIGLSKENLAKVRSSVDNARSSSGSSKIAEDLKSDSAVIRELCRPSLTRQVSSRLSNRASTQQLDSLTSIFLGKGDSEKYIRKVQSAKESCAKSSTSMTDRRVASASHYVNIGDTDNEQQEKASVESFGLRSLFK